MTHWPDFEYHFAAEGVAYVEAVESSEVHAFCEHFEILISAIRVEGLEEPWDSVRAVLSKIRFRLLALPVALGSGQMDVRSSIAEIERLLRQIGANDANRGLVERSLDALRAISDVGDSNPLGERVLDILSTGETGSRGVVVLRSDWVSPTSNWLKDHIADARVWWRGDAGLIPLRQMLVLPGRPTWFARKGVESTPFVSAPRSESTCFVQFDFLGEPESDPGLLKPDKGGVSRRIIGGFKVPAGVIEDSEWEVEDFDWERYRDRGRRATEPDQLVEARVVTFADGSCTYISTSDESTVQVVGSNPSGHINLRSKPSQDLVVGDVLILRTEGSDSEYVRGLADSMFGATEHRPAIANWKQRVRVSIDAAGGLSAARRELGPNSSAARNLDHWITDAAIRPRERSDFEAVSSFAGYSNEQSAEVWGSMTQVFTAHVNAGQKIRELLESGLEDRSLESLEDADFVEVDLDGHGTLRASRVTGLSPFTDLVPQRWIGVFNPEDVD